jgi:hypothetical protein
MLAMYLLQVTAFRLLFVLCARDLALQVTVDETRATTCRSTPTTSPAWTTVPALFADKKLHAFRVQCPNVLGSTGASEAERECHIGWQSTVQSRHYSSLKHAALNARTGHLLAGRADATTSSRMRLLRPLLKKREREREKKGADELERVGAVAERNAVVAETYGGRAASVFAVVDTVGMLIRQVNYTIKIHDKAWLADP